MYNSTGTASCGRQKGPSMTQYARLYSKQKIWGGGGGGGESRSGVSRELLDCTVL